MRQNQIYSAFRRCARHVSSYRIFQSNSLRFKYPLLLVILFSAFHSNIAISFEDDEGCLLCHKYPKMGRVTEDGARRSYYIIPEIFGKTVHRNVPCRDCHNYIDQLPHRKVVEGVRCDTECHSIENPATGKKFSHKPIYDKYKQSTHFRNKLATGDDQDKPYCVTCHNNPIYNPDEEKVPKEVTERCVICHEDGKFVDNWYKHTSRRIKEVKRNSIEIIELCSNCHGDKTLVARHMSAAKKDGRELGKKYESAVETYNESFHGKVAKYGSKATANCLDCHADRENYYLNVHDIRPSNDEKSPVNEKNRVKTCQRCHVNAGENYAKIDPHPLPATQQENNQFRFIANKVYSMMGDSVILFLISLQIIETFARRRDGVCWRLVRGSSWRRRSKRGRNRSVTSK